MDDCNCCQGENCPSCNDPDNWVCGQCGECVYCEDLAASRAASR